MSTFFDKNKKKGALAALLLFLRTRKTVTILLVLLALATFSFVGPSNFLLGVPGADRAMAALAWLAGKAGVDTSKWGLAGGKRDYNDLLAAFRAAKDGSGAKGGGWGSFMRGGEGIRAGSGSLYFVKGDAKDLEVKGGSGEKLAKPGSVGGVLNKEDAKNRGEGEGVALSDEDLAGGQGAGGRGEGGLVKSAFASGFGTGAGSMFGSLSGGAFAGSGFFSGGKSATTGKLGDVVKGGLDGIKPAANANGAQIQGGAKGRLSASMAKAINTRTNQGMVRTHTISGQRAFVQLASGRGRAAISVAPNCTAEGGCPAEFAATNTGAVYDGNTISGTRTDILSVPHIDDIGTAGGAPNIPDTSIATDYVNDAEQMVKDAETCRKLNEEYGPKETEYDQRQQKLSDEFDAMGCGEGGCNKKKAHACERKGDEMIALCKEAMALRCEHIHKCPLTKDNACSASECEGAARDKKKLRGVVDGHTADGKDITSTTKDQGETDEGCPSAKQDVPHRRQDAQNAIKEYRDNNCVALHADTSYSGQITYYNKCSGREVQVVQTCSQYAFTLCISEHQCTDVAACKDQKNDCTIDHIDDIEEFIRKEAATH